MKSRRPGLGGELIDGSQVESYIVVRLGCVTDGFLLVECLAVLLKEYEMSVLTRNHRAGPVAGLVADGDIDVEFRWCVLVMAYRDSAFRDISVATLNGLGSDIAEHFKAIFRLADERAERHRDRQAYHACAGMPTPIAFFSIFPLRATSMRAGRQPRSSVALGHAESHGDRLCTADCGNDFAIDERDYLFSL